MEELDAPIAPVVAIANDVLQDRRSPYEGAKELWRLSSEMYDLPEAGCRSLDSLQSGRTTQTIAPSTTRTNSVAMERLRRRFGP
jgi:hypothetical protein